MTKIKYIGLFLIASVFLAACAASETSGDYATNANTESAAPMTQEVAEKSADDGSGSKQTANPQAPVSMDEAEKSKEAEPAKVTERKIIRNATLQLETASPEEAQKKIAAIADSKKGFVITSSQRNTNAKISGSNSVSMTIRVPADKFQETIEEIRKTVDRVIVETISGQDVTEEFVDVEARLKAKKALEERYLEIMKQAKSVADALEVERQLANVRTEIESIEGKKRFLENQSSLSTINIELQTPAAISASSSGFFYELQQALSDGFEAALTFILVLIRIVIAILPFLILIVLPILLFLRYYWKRFKKKRTARKIVEEELKEEKIIDVE